MRVPFYDIKAQYTELSEEIDRVVHEVIASGSYMMGHHHNTLEREIADLHGCKHGIALNSGTDALRIILDSLGIGPGDEVITGAFTFVASVETIVQTRARPVLVDIDRDTFHIDARQVEAAITERTAAIMPIHLFGQLSDVEALREVSERRGIPIIEDAAQAIGSAHRGRYAGKFGSAAAFSFYVTKNLGAAGDAGLILTDDDEIADRCRSIRVHGMGRERYYYDHVGYTSRMDEVQAAVLRVKLTRLVDWNCKRGENAKCYLQLLKDCPVRLPSIAEGNNHTWHQFTIRTPKRDELMAFLKERGIDSMIYYPVPLHFHSPYAEFGGGPGSLPETEQTCKEVLSLPVHQHLGPDQVAYVAKTVREFFHSRP